LDEIDAQQHPASHRFQSRVYTVDEVVPRTSTSFYAAFVVSFLLTPGMRVVALYYGVIDRPDHGRKVHTVPIAYLGGVAVFMGWLAGLTVSQFLPLHRSSRLAHVLPGRQVQHRARARWSSSCSAVGRRTVRRPLVKIGGQVAAALFLLWDGVGLTAAKPLLTPSSPAFSRSPASSGCCTAGSGRGALVPEWLIVAAQLRDGDRHHRRLLQRLEPHGRPRRAVRGVTAIIAAGSCSSPSTSRWSAAASTRTGTRCASSSAWRCSARCSGSCPYNFNPGSIFMGDTGSMLLGYACGTMIILLAQQQAKWGLAAMVIFALPILDHDASPSPAASSRAAPLFQADRQHFHHQLVARGFTVKQTVLISTGCRSSSPCWACRWSSCGRGTRMAIYMVTFAYLIVAAYKMAWSTSRPRIVRRQDSAHPPRGDATPNRGGDGAGDPGGRAPRARRRARSAPRAAAATGWSSAPARAPPPRPAHRAAPAAHDRDRPPGLKGGRAARLAHSAGALANHRLRPKCAAGRAR
jgi:UDP-GlcNAc:undecaprenyl-phosphate GlcNAc-1-phosphate transferase